VTATARLQGFPPLAAAGARVLVLGTMPGAASLRAGEYYAHPRNAFWGIMAALLEGRQDAPYAERVAAVTRRGIAVWDVLGACSRAGSLDTAIDPKTIVVNDFGGFFAAQPRLALVVFNGGKAAELFSRHALPILGPGTGPPTLRLPSTSPTNARLRFDAKLAAWRAALAPHLEEAARCPPPSACWSSTSSGPSSTGAAR